MNMMAGMHSGRLDTTGESAQGAEIFSAFSTEALIWIALSPHQPVWNRKKLPSL